MLDYIAPLLTDGGEVLRQMEADVFSSIFGNSRTGSSFLTSKTELTKMYLLLYVSCGTGRPNRRVEGVWVIFQTNFRGLSLMDELDPCVRQKIAPHDIATCDLG